MDPKWLEWTRTLQAIAQNGLYFTESIYDRERFAQIRDLAVEIMSSHTGADAIYLRELFDRQTGYATPKVDVRGVVFKNDAMLLVREKADEGRWTLPGGWADVNDTPSEAVVREIHEESGYSTKAVKLLAVYDRNKQGHTPFPFHVYKLYFLCELIEDAPDVASHDHETGEATFFTEDQLPADLSLGRVLPSQIARFFVHHRNPSLPTDFD